MNIDNHKLQLQQYDYCFLSFTLIKSKCNITEGKGRPMFSRGHDWAAYDDDDEMNVTYISTLSTYTIQFYGFIIRKEFENNVSSCVLSSILLQQLIIFLVLIQRIESNV